MSIRAKRLTFEVMVDRAGRAGAEGSPSLELPPEWEAEHLLLAGLVRCSLTSLAYHVRQTGGDAVGSGEARGVITRRDSDGRYAFVEIEARLDVEIEPAPEGAALAELLGNAERDCFIAASLTTGPAYRWRVNGADV